MWLERHDIEDKLLKSCVIGLSLHKVSLQNPGGGSKKNDFLKPSHKNY